MLPKYGARRLIISEKNHFPPGFFDSFCQRERAKLGLLMAPPAERDWVNPTTVSGPPFWVSFQPIKNRVGAGNERNEADLVGGHVACDAGCMQSFRERQ